MFLCATGANAGAATPPTSCPSGYVAVVVENATIGNSSSCPSGYKKIENIDVCTGSGSGAGCALYALANKEYTDNTGTYIFTQNCPL